MPDNAVSTTPLAHPSNPKTHGSPDADIIIKNAPDPVRESKAELRERILDLEKFEEVVVGRELKMIALEKEIEHFKREPTTYRGQLS